MGWLFLLIFLIAPAQASPETACLDSASVVKNDGHCWNALPDMIKHWIVRGIWTGIESNSTALRWVDVGPNGVDMDHTSIPEGTVVSDISTYFDTLYSYPVNRQIKWYHAYMLSRIKCA